MNHVVLLIGMNLQLDSICLLASNRGERAPDIAKQVGCHKQVVICGFNAIGLAVLEEESSRPIICAPPSRKNCWNACKTSVVSQPACFQQRTRHLTLEMAAMVNFEQGVTDAQASDERVHRALRRPTTIWKRPKHWITSPRSTIPAQKNVRDRSVADGGSA